MSLKLETIQPLSEPLSDPSSNLAVQTISHKRTELFFPALDALRFFASTAVIVHHTEQFKSITLEPNNWHTYTIDQLGTQGVHLFFVLSAFLLTYLMLQETQVTGRVSVAKFYARRALRIMPLYLLIVAVSFFIIPLVAAYIFPAEIAACVESTIPALPQTLLLYLLMLPNLSWKLIPMVVGVSQSWSVGTEEQFYLIWPHLVNIFKKRPIMLLIAFKVMLIALPPATKSLFTALHLTHSASPFVRVIPHFVLNVCNQFDMMFFGAVAAIVFLHAKPSLLNKIYHPLTRIWLVLTVGFFVTVKLCPPDTVLGIAFALFTVSLTDANIKYPFQKSIQYLGRISYGTYMYHVIVLCMVLRFMRWDALPPMSQFSRELTTYTLIFAVTTAVSALSYRFLEAPILLLKKRFTVIGSDSL